MSQPGVMFQMLQAQNGRSAYSQLVEIFPFPKPLYTEEAVSPEVRRDFQEALQCEAAGFFIAAALVGRRVLQGVVREKTPPDVQAAQAAKLEREKRRFLSLHKEIEDLPDSVLPPILKGAAHEVQLVGADAAHAEAITKESVRHLLRFTTQVLQYLYVLPAEVEASKDSRTADKV